ncbi:amino acid permease [Terrimonas sp. NA20]|uniref:Amino acid permease n=1 Tax=Terrimonas ginsenosidimutans TaxID=2908004 RepID=A0ABS9KXS6_9BACT|nr:amino acid permease [Terrimonas ginsenosidimutans]MCG2617103.1 amino acid permease [Terrimonas ginsenosidimutans]
MPSTLSKKIGFWSATSIIAGSIIGSAVFIKPAAMAAQLGSPVLLTVVWVIAGLLSLSGAMIYAELGAAMPETGGIYVFFRRIFGNFTAFLYGWSALAVINTAAVAAIAFVCARYANYFLHLPYFDESTIAAARLHIPLIGDLFPLQDIGIKSVAVLLVLSFTWLNYRSARAGNGFQVISTVLKLAVIAILIGGLLFSGKGDVANFFHNNAQLPDNMIGAIVVAMTGAFYAYDGWINITFVAGEIKDPQKNIPRSLITGMLICMIVYVLINQAYLYILPVEKMSTSSLVAADAIEAAWGHTGGLVIAVFIVICTLGAVNGNLMTTARVTYAMGHDRNFFHWAGKTHKTYLTPGNALWLHAAWTCLFIITGSFDMLADMFVFVTWIAYALGAVGIFMLRKKKTGTTLPYKSWGYPVLPFLFILFSLFYLIVTVWNDISNYINHRQPVINSLLGLLLTASGIPLYFYLRRKTK